MPDQGMHVSNAASGTATVNLRGLGANRTLVLVDGRRLLPGEYGYPAPDINLVPSALIRRVEVLTGGASSVYGSDAVAGVVNLIIDHELDGLRIDAQSSIFQHDNRDVSDISDYLRAANFPFPKGNAVDGGVVDFQPRLWRPVK